MIDLTGLKFSMLVLKIGVVQCSVENPGHRSMP